MTPAPFPGKIETARMIFNLVYRYLLFTGAFYFIFYVALKKRFWFAKIQQRYPDNKNIVREIKYSFLTIVIFGGIIYLTIWAGKNGLTQVYAPIEKYGYAYLALSVVLMIVLHDAYFYWTHRLLHRKPLFKYVHKTHHLSINPTPFAAYAFHPLEAVVEVGIVPVIAFTIPHHALAMSFFAIYSLLLNVLGHLGFEVFPKNFARHWLFKWHNTSTHHNMHHRLTKCNYGLYFNFWDRVMGTNHPHYEESFDAVVETRRNAKASAPQPELIVDQG
jgi:sterol desaturase/sphingolipid hydroxylase (fatty acid hydroxylase superfamily)